MIKYEIKLEESLIDRLLHRNIVNCLVTVYPTSDEEYYRSFTLFSDKLTTYFPHSYKLKFNKLTNSLTPESVPKINKLYGSLKLTRVGIEECYDILDGATKIMEQFRKSNSKLNDTMIFIARLHIRCKVYLLVNSSMYESPNIEHIVNNDKYRINLPGEYIVNLYSLPSITLATDRTEINNIINSLKRRS
jgi:hypothetical protein